MPGRALAVALAASLLAACGGSSNKGGGAGAACDPAKPCASPLGCVFGRCTAVVGAGGACSATSPCAAPQACVGGTCVDRPAAGTCGGSASIVAAGTIAVDPALATKYQAVPANTTAPPQDCVLPVQAPVGATPIAHASSAAVGTRLAFTVPPNTTALSVVSQEVNASALDSFTYRTQTYPNYVVPTGVTAPDGTVVYDDATVPYPISDVNAYANLLAYDLAPGVGAGAFTIPNTSRALDDTLACGGLPAGSWSLVVNDWATEFGVAGASNGIYDVTVLARQAPVAGTGTVDVAVYLVTRGTLTSGNAANDPGFARWVQTYRTILARLGVCLGTVRVYDVPQWAKDRWYSVNIDMDKPCDPQAQLFTLAQPVNAVHLFFTDELVTTAPLPPGSILAGIDGTIPGPSLVPGIVNSGAAVAIGADLESGTCGGSINTASCGADYLAYVSAHETGHWLGLYHTTETDGSAFDPLRDTPACPCRSCAGANVSKCGGASPPNLTADLCTGANATCGGAQNLMFWILDDAIATGAVSPEQGTVARYNPAVH